MQKSPFVWLGSRRARKYDVGQPSRLLDEVASAGLPVPPGAILLDEFYQLLLEADVVRVEAGHLTIPDQAVLADSLYHGIRFPQLDYPVTLRPMFAEAGTRSDIGDAERWQRPAVDFRSAPQVAESLAAAWQAALVWERLHQATPDLRRDIVVMKAVTAAANGIVTSRLEAPGDWVHYRDGAEAKTLSLPRLGSWQRPGSQFPPFGRRLQKLLRGVRRTVGQGDWQIQWADDGQICWLVQIRSVAKRPTPPA